MLAMLTKGASKLVDFTRPEPVVSEGKSVGLSSSQNFLPPDAQVLSELCLPGPDTALQTVSNVCGKLLSPLYYYVESTLGEDVENLVQTLNEADPEIAAVLSTLPNDDEDIYVISDTLPSEGVSGCDTPRREDPSRFPSPATNFVERESEYVNSSASECSTEAGPSRSLSNTIAIPSIVITPAPYQAPEKSSWVPIQDTRFGQRLTVPTHTALNSAHPPMVVPAYYHTYSRTHVVRCWTYKHGHWCAVVPGLDEQERRGLFSRPLGVRRRSALGSARKRTPRDSPNNRQKISARSKRES